MPDQIPRVAVMLAARNGEKFIGEQLRSIAGQLSVHIELWISDDGSTDRTLDEIEDFVARTPDIAVHVVNGPRRGFVQNFLSMVCNPDIRADYFAFCDQDDVWHSDKLRTAIDILRSVPDGLPSLYTSRTNTLDRDGRIVGMSPLFTRPPSLENALVQSIGGGNTMVFNQSARDLLAKAGNVPVISHDWWIYILASGNEGQIHYDPRPTIDYRQHGSNLIGANSGMSDRLLRIRRMLSGHFHEWNDVNLKALLPQLELLSESNQMVLKHFIKARAANLPVRLPTMLRSGVYRQTLLGNLGLVAATLLRKI